MKNATNNTDTKVSGVVFNYLNTGRIKFNEHDTFITNGRNHADLWYGKVVDNVHSYIHVWFVLTDDEVKEFYKSPDTFVFRSAGASTTLTNIAESADTNDYKQDFIILNGYTMQGIKNYINDDIVRGIFCYTYNTQSMNAFF